MYIHIYRGRKQNYLTILWTHNPLLTIHDSLFLNLTSLLATHTHTHPPHSSPLQWASLLPSPTSTLSWAGRGGQVRYRQIKAEEGPSNWHCHRLHFPHALASRATFSAIRLNEYSKGSLSPFPKLPFLNDYCSYHDSTQEKRLTLCPKQMTQESVSQSNPPTTWTVCWKCRLLGSTPGLLNLNFWEWSPEIPIFGKLQGASHALQVWNPL